MKKEESTQYNQTPITIKKNPEQIYCINLSKLFYCKKSTISSFYIF